ncbi:MAG: hypothetical protein Q8M07_14715, partial [Prosthecobacter sp.]|nr:hypothetical protein [Prosthecobacter sp.]
ALLRDRLEVLRNFKSHRSLASSYGENRDVFALYREESLAALSVLMVRGGSISDSQSFFFQDVGVSDGEILEAALGQFYQSGREIPDEVVLPLELENISFLRSAWMTQRGAAIEITVPKRGVKVRQLDLAALNAKEHFGAHFDAETRYLEIARLAARSFKLRQMPRRIECLDISNFQGSDIVGAIVVFYDGKPDKSSYRRYKISQQGKPDDFASVHEVVTRRLRDGQESGQMPDLLVIDGGPGQLAMALKARDELSVSLDIVSLAKMKTEGDALSQEIEKKPERIYLEGVEEPVPLEASSELTRFLQRLRDETHRFVITFHRSTRAKRVFKSILDEIPGVGPERRRRLFKAYGSIEAMKQI